MRNQSPSYRYWFKVLPIFLLIPLEEWIYALCQSVYYQVPYYDFLFRISVSSTNSYMALEILSNCTQLRLISISIIRLHTLFVEWNLYRVRKKMYIKSVREYIGQLILRQYSIRIFTKHICYSFYKLLLKTTMYFL